MTMTRCIGLVAMAISLGACGGGSGSDTASSFIELLPTEDDVREAAADAIRNNDDPSTTAYTRSSDFTSHPGHLLTGVEEAYKRGITGEGVIVAVVDDGIDSDNPEFSGRMLAGFNAFTNRRDGDPTVRNDCNGLSGCDTGRHGTLVSGVIAAANDGKGAHGVAPGATLFGLNVDTGSNDGFLSGEEIANSLGFSAALASGARIFNHSYAVTFDPSQEASFRAGAGGIYDNILTAFRAGGIHVYATGNSGTDVPSMESLWPVWKPDLAGGIIAVTGIVRDEDTGTVRLASYANKCGDAQDWCLSAPTGDFGNNERFVALVAPGPDGTYNTFDDPDQNGLQNSAGGTSAAAAYVSGALALLKQAFPELSGEELGAILLSTASDMGAAGTDATFGRGAVDIAEAILPQGTPSVASGPTLASAMTPLSQTNLSVGSALAGSSLLKGQTMVFFDKFGRAYPIDASALVAKSAPYRESLSRLDDTLASLDGRGTGVSDTGKPLSFNVSSTSHNGAAGAAADTNTLLMLVMRDGNGASAFGSSTSLNGGFLALAPEAAASVLRYALSPSSSLSVTMGSSRATSNGTLDDGEDLATLDYAYSVDKNLALGLRAGVLREQGGLLGSSGEGALSLSDTSMTRFVEGRFVRRMAKNVALIGEVGVGQTDSAAATGYLDFDGPLTSVETRLGLALSNLGRKGDQLTLSGGIPLHIVDGTAKTRLPTGRDAEGNITYTTSETSLKSDIPLEMRLDYAVPLSERLTVGINSAMRRDGDDEVYGDVALGLRLKF